MNEKLTEILTSENVQESVRENQDYLLMLIPELRYMIGFEHNHPQHHLNVWEHTLQVIANLKSSDEELNMAALLHDIGKPFSYQDEEVRHFHGHPQVSSEMTLTILTRIGYDEKFITNVSYIVLNHDTVIQPSNLDASRELILKRLELQYADAKAHHPDKVAKRLKILDDIKKELDLFLYS